MLLKSEQIKGPFFDLSYTFVLDEAHFFHGYAVKIKQNSGIQLPTSALTYVVV